MGGSNWSGANWPAQFRSNGERIYFTGTSASGVSITSASDSMHMQMHGGGCVNCHGADRQGGRLMPQFWMIAPALTPAALFGGHDDAPDKDGHGDHAEYDEAALRRAITEGIDPAGKRLDTAMPRWTMAERDLGDLIAFLKDPPSKTQN